MSFFKRKMKEPQLDCQWHEHPSGDFTTTINTTTPWPTTKGSFNVVCTSCGEHFIVKGEQTDLV